MKEIYGYEEAHKIGPRIKEHLFQKGISIQKASDDLQIEKSYYYKLLKGDRGMTIDNIVAHALYLDVSIEYLLFGEEKFIYDKNDVIIPGEIEIMMEKTVIAIEMLPSDQRALRSMIDKP